MIRKGTKNKLMNQVRELQLIKIQVLINTLIHSIPKMHQHSKWPVIFMKIPFRNKSKARESSQGYTFKLPERSHKTFDFKFLIGKTLFKVLKIKESHQLVFQNT